MTVLRRPAAASDNGGGARRKKWRSQTQGLSNLSAQMRAVRSARDPVSKALLRRNSPRGGNGGPWRIRTSGLCLRRAALYPAELRDRSLRPRVMPDCVGKVQGFSAPRAAPHPVALPVLRPGSQGFFNPFRMISRCASRWRSRSSGACLLKIMLQTAAMIAGLMTIFSTPAPRSARNSPRSMPY